MIEVGIGQSADDWARNMVTVRAVETVGAYKYVTMLPVTNEMMLDGLATTTDWANNRIAIRAEHRSAGLQISTFLERMLRPWTFPDRPVVWEFDLFPKLTAIAKRWAVVKAWPGAFRRRVGLRIAGVEEWEVGRED